MSLESPPQKEIGKEPAKQSRREFLKRGGQFFGGALVAGSMYEKLRSVKKRKEYLEHKFSWQNLEAEINQIKKEFADRWEQEIRRRLRKGIDLYFKDAAQHYIQLKRKAKVLPPNLPPGFLEGAEVAIAKNFIDKFGSGEKLVENIKDVNKILLFGSVGTGVVTLGERIAEIRKERDPSRQLQILKQETENVAFAAIGIKEGHNSTSKTTVSTPYGLDENLAAIMIAETISDYQELLIQIGALTMFEQWGAGASILFLKV